MKKAVFLLLTTPIVWICVVTIFPLIMIHVPYLGMNCGSLACAAGSVESFMLWTGFSLLAIGMIMGCAWEGLVSRQKIVYISQGGHDGHAHEHSGAIQRYIHPA
jgi:hypothetical protein